ncbi:MAG: hypothetical protein NZ954_07615 [Thermofilaceae archaeon]|nr:hypothetical protein [Thermofilaceae archaeon]MCX8179964.1 hypothetical protein [Thermofilaceae archaeon]MDW8004731.1 hypothetical protein [Thermofilaceae archaeon]
MKKLLKLVVFFLISANVALIVVYYEYFVDKFEPYSWSITQKGDILQIAYGMRGSYPQYAALHLDSGYFRVNYGPESG